jgi:hypothetical protein
MINVIVVQATRIKIANKNMVKKLFILSMGIRVLIVYFRKYLFGKITGTGF